MSEKKKQVEKVHKVSYLVKENSRLLDQILKNLVDTSNSILLILSDNKVVYFNSNFTKYLGYTLGDLKNNLLDNIFSTGKSDLLKRNISRDISIRKKSKEPTIVAVKSKNGVEIHFESIVHRCLWKGNSSVLLKLNHYPKKPDQSVSDGREATRIKLALMIAHHGVWDRNLKTGESFISSEFFDLLGFNPSEISSNYEQWLNLLHPESAQLYHNLEKEILDGNVASNKFEYRIKSSKGEYLWMLAIIQVVEWDNNGIPVRVLGIHTNISERKRIDSEKEVNQETLKGFIKNSLDGFVIIDEMGVVIDWNHALEEITQIKSEIAVGSHIQDLTQSNLNDPDLHLSFPELLQKVFYSISHTGKNPHEGKVFDTTILVKDGSYKLIRLSIFTIKTCSGTKIGASVEDITLRNTSQKKVEKNEERLKLALASGNMGVWDIDFITGERYFSPMTFTLLGYMPWEIDPTTDMWKSTIHPNDLEFVLKNYSSLFISGSNLEMEFRMRKKDGTYIWVISRLKMIRNELGKSIRAIGIVADISRRKNIEIELRSKKEELSKNLAQHELISEISFVFNSNKPLEAKNQNVIELLGRFTNVSRVYIFENKPEKNLTVNTYEWCNQNVIPQKDNFQDFPLDVALQWTQGKDVLVSMNIEKDLPSNFSEILVRQNIKSLLIFPLYVCENLFGFIGFDECNYNRIWEKSEIELLRSISNMISFSFERELMTNQHKQNEAIYKELTEKLPQIIFDISVDGQIQFLNQTGCDFFGTNKNRIANGLHVKDIFPYTEVERMKTIRHLAIASENLEPVELLAIASKGKTVPIKVYTRPRIERSEIVGFTGIAHILGDVD